MNGNWKQVLEPWATRYTELVEALNTLCVDLSDKDLQRFGDAAVRPTTTNCWWATYAVAPLVREAVAREQQRRRAQVARNAEVDR